MTAGSVPRGGKCFFQQYLRRPTSYCASFSLVGAASHSGICLTSRIFHWLVCALSCPWGVAAVAAGLLLWLTVCPENMLICTHVIKTTHLRTNCLFQELSLLILPLIKRITFCHYKSNVFFIKENMGKGKLALTTPSCEGRTAEIPVHFLFLCFVCLLSVAQIVLVFMFFFKNPVCKYFLCCLMTSFKNKPNIEYLLIWRNQLGVSTEVSSFSTAL